AAAERRVEVDQVHPTRAVALPGQRGLARVAVAGLAAGGAAPQPDRSAVRDVDRGQQGERHRVLQSSVRSQLRSSAAPASPDFSGWNWRGHSGPRSTAATNDSPCSAVVTRPSVAVAAYEWTK